MNQEKKESTPLSATRGQLVLNSAGEFLESVWKVSLRFIFLKAKGVRSEVESVNSDISKLNIWT